MDPSDFEGLNAETYLRLWQGWARLYRWVATASASDNTVLLTNTAGSRLYAVWGSEDLDYTDPAGSTITVPATAAELVLLNAEASWLELKVLLLLNRSNRVPDWPEDEAAAYRSKGGFAEGRAAADRLRAAKLIELVRSSSSL